MFEPVSGDLVALSEEGADLVGVDMREHRGDGEGRSEVVTLQYGQQRRETLIGAELGLRCRQVGGADAIGSGREAHIDSDADAAAASCGQRISSSARLFSF